MVCMQMCALSRKHGRVFQGLVSVGHWHWVRMGQRYCMVLPLLVIGCNWIIAAWFQLSKAMTLKPCRWWWRFCRAFLCSSSRAWAYVSRPMGPHWQRSAAPSHLLWTRSQPSWSIKKGNTSWGSFKIAQPDSLLEMSSSPKRWSWNRSTLSEPCCQRLSVPCQGSSFDAVPGATISWPVWRLGG